VVWLGVGDDASAVSQAARRLQVPFESWADPDGWIASSFNHWRSPTLYVLGKWGAVRYAGELEPARLQRMLTMLTRETPEGDHQYFATVGSDIGHRAPDFAAIKPDGDSVRLESLLHNTQLVCLLFAGSNLKGARPAVGWMVDLVDEVGSERLTACIIFTGVEPPAISSVYGSPPSGVLIVADPEGEATRLYRADEPPIWVLLGPRGRVLYRGISTAELAAGFSRPEGSPQTDQRPVPRLPPS
jgi:hypothetical protein